MHAGLPPPTSPSLGSVQAPDLSRKGAPRSLAAQRPAALVPCLAQPLGLASWRWVACHRRLPGLGAAQRGWPWLKVLKLRLSCLPCIHLCPDRRVARLVEVVEGVGALGAQPCPAELQGLLPVLIYAWPGVPFSGFVECASGLKGLLRFEDAARAYSPGFLSSPSWRRHSFLVPPRNFINIPDELPPRRISSTM